MSANKTTVEKYIDGFNKSDHEQILSCLTDDIEWTVFGWYRLAGKEAYDNEIENPAFTGSPTLAITRMVEEGDVVMAELTGEVRRASWRADEDGDGRGVRHAGRQDLRTPRLRGRAQGERLHVRSAVGEGREAGGLRVDLV
jgi:ketosteroid isomerase-like protein